MGAVRECLGRVRRWRISHIWREANRTADYLAYFGCSLSSSDVLVMEEPPNGLRRMLHEDKLGLGMNRLVRE